MFNPSRKSDKKKDSGFVSPVSNLHPQFELNDMEAHFHNDIIKRLADDNPFTFIRRKDTDATIFRVNHLRVSIEEAKRIREFMSIHIHKGHKEFIIDLSNCEFMDSTFLGAIIILAKKLNNENGKIILVAKPEKLKVLNVLRELNKILNVSLTVDEAVIILERDRVNNYINNEDI